MLPLLLGRMTPSYKLACLVCCVVVSTNAFAQSPGQTPPTSILKELKPVEEQCQRALESMDADAVKTGVEQAIKILGPWAGNPESVTRYFPASGVESPDIEKLRTWWQREMQRNDGVLPWIRNPNGDPRKMTAGLRAAAWPIDALGRSATIFPQHSAELTLQAKAGADWLIKLQHPSGVFPFPIGPGLDPRDKVGHIVARAMKERPEIVVNDWIPDDFSDGGLQFDNGLCGKALVTIWKLTHEKRYLEAARRAGDWAIERPLVLNWNYNAFSVGLLARLAESTGEVKYLDAAVLKAKLGVLPGQMQSGRWFDAHNACAVYHNILLRELLELLHVMPEDHVFRATLLDAVKRGLDQAAAETLANGFTGTWTDNFAQGLLWIEENETWRKALNTCINAAGKNGAPTLGFAALPALEAVMATSPSPSSK